MQCQVVERKRSIMKRSIAKLTMSGPSGGGGVTLNWEADRADQVNTNCPVYIDATHEISLSTASTVSITCIMYQFTEI